MTKKRISTGDLYAERAEEMRNREGVKDDCSCRKQVYEHHHHHPHHFKGKIIDGRHESRKRVPVKRTVSAPIAFSEPHRSELMDRAFENTRMARVHQLGDRRRCVLFRRSLSMSSHRATRRKDAKWNEKQDDSLQQLLRTMSRESSMQREIRRAVFYESHSEKS